MRLQVIYNIADKIIKLGAIFVVSVVAARVFSRDDYGVFVYVNVILAIAASIYSSGIDTSIGVKVANDKFLDSDFIVAATLVKFSIAVVASSIVYMHIYNKYLAHPNGRMMAIAAGAACLTGALVSAEVVLTALRKNKTMLALSITLVIPLCLLKLAVIKYYGTVFVKYFVDCIEIAIIAVAAWLVCKSSYKEGTYTGALKAKFKTIIKDSYPLWLNGIILVAYSRYDQLFVGIVGSLGETADYAIATQLNSLALIIPTSIALVIFPKMVELRNSNTISYEGLIIKIYRIMMLYAGAWMIMVFIFGEFAIKLLYGESYLNAAIYLRIVSIGTIFTVIGQVSGQLTVIEGKYWMSIKRSLVGIAFMIIANYTISSANNIKIVAYVTVVNLFIVNILMYIVLNDAKSISKLFFKAIGLRQVRY